MNPQSEARSATSWAPELPSPELYNPATGEGMVSLRTVERLLREVGAGRPARVEIDPEAIEAMCWVMWPSWKNPGLRSDADRALMRKLLEAAAKASPQVEPKTPRLAGALSLVRRLMEALPEGKGGESGRLRMEAQTFLSGAAGQRVAAPFGCAGTAKVSLSEDGTEVEDIEVELLPEFEEWMNHRAPVELLLYASPRAAAQTLYDAELLDSGRIITAGLDSLGSPVEVLHEPINLRRAIEAAGHAAPSNPVCDNPCPLADRGCIGFDFEGGGCPGVPGEREG